LQLQAARRRRTTNQVSTLAPASEASISTSTTRTTSKRTIDAYKSDDTAWKAFGGWRLNPYLSFELAYVNLGSPDDEVLPDTQLTVETDGFAPYVVGTLPIGDWFEVFAKAGYYWYDVETRVNSPLGDFSSKDSDETFTWSAGLGVNIFEHVNVRLEYEQFDLTMPTRRTRSGSRAPFASDRLGAGLACRCQTT
jgi:hypothetical protein